MILEIIVFVLVVGMLIKLMSDAKRGIISRSKLVFWAFVWIGLEIIVIFPGIVIYLASVVGIERPKDLPIYVSIIILFVVMLKIVVKLEKIEQEITSIVKGIALKKDFY